MSQNPSVLANMTDALTKVGAGSGERETFLGPITIMFFLKENYVIFIRRISSSFNSDT